VGNSAVVPLTLKIGTYTFTLTVTDAGGLSSTATTHVTITNTPPVANAGPDQTLPATGPTTAVKLNGSLSSDPDGDALTFVWTQGGTVVGNSAVVPLTLKIGTYTFTLTVTDAGGLSSSAVTRVTITNLPPVANAGADQTLECTGNACASATLNGSASSDPDGDALSFVWKDEGGNVVGTAAVAQVKVGLGTHTFTLTVTDAGGLSSMAATHVTVQDTKPPMLSVSLSPNVLWPPNNKLVQITAQIQASDVCDANPTVQLVSITSNGSDSGDIQAVGGGPIAFGTDVRSFLLRAARSAQGHDRIYTVTYQAKDASGNTTVASAQVRVGNPHQYVSPKHPRNSNGDHYQR
jgi:PKD repeat protein